MSPANALLCTLALSLALSLAPAAARADGVLVFAAASLTNALAEIEAGFEAATGHDLVVSLGGASAMARQIELGAPADIFISSSIDWMDHLETAGLLAAGSRFDLLGNRLVLISHGDAAPVSIAAGFDLPGLLGGGWLAMALVDSVPAGIYGKAALENLGLWPAVEAQVAQTDNVRSALALVATGEARFGIVYASDAVAEDRVSIVGTFPASSHARIFYPAARIANRDSAAAAAFLDWLRGREARVAFERQHFAVLTP